MKTGFMGVLSVFVAFCLIGVCGRQVPLERSLNRHIPSNRGAFISTESNTSCLKRPCLFR